MKHFGKKILALFMALMCLATIGAVSASAKTTSYDKEYNKALKAAQNNSATYKKDNWTGPHPTTQRKNGKTVKVGTNNQNYVTGEQINVSSHPKSGYASQYSISVNDKSGKYAYEQKYGVKNGQKMPEKIGHAKRYVNVLG